ncbi:MAG: VWA domain-containing protein [Acidobacteria bacterium]|nr:VWA domain-containing protein [Acidobacteriota bacterium]
MTLRQPPAEATTLRLEPPSEQPERQNGQASLPGGRNAAAKTASKTAPTKTSFTCRDRGFRRCLGVLAFLALGFTAASAQKPTFKSGTQLVALYVTVTDGQGRLVPDLGLEDFQILDNDQPQRITLFENAVQPITAVVMLDTSASMTLNLKLVRSAAEQFLIRMLPQDRGRVGAFNDKIEFSPEFTSDRDDLISALKDLDFGNPTRLYDAIDASIDELRGIEGRRVVLVFTDGEDSASQMTLGRAIDRARNEEMMVYAIGLESDYFLGPQRVRTKPDRGLKKIADETGGGYFELKKTDELGPAFTRVAQELHSQYVIGFAPQLLDGKVHKLAVKLTKPGMSARARKSYLATGDTPTSSK